jgi:hypothetical protein
VDDQTVMRLIALWALVSRTSAGERAWRAMGHGHTLEGAYAIDSMHPDMDEYHAWAERTYGDKAREYARKAAA